MTATTIPAASETSESTPPAATCLTTGCASAGTPAEVTGVFDCEALNGRAPRPAAYCIRCAVALAESGYFTPTDGTALPSLIDWIVANEPKAWAAD